MVSEPIEINDDPRDVLSDRLLCGRIGRLLAETYPDWTWGVEIPPEQNAVIIRNLTLDPRGKYGMFTWKSELDPTLRAVVTGAGEFLERYEHLKKHPGRFGPEDLSGYIMACEKPEI